MRVGVWDDWFGARRLLLARSQTLLQLTAQFTAVGGRNFLSELAKREARNEQFQFLKHTHALFSYFTRCVVVGAFDWHVPATCINSSFGSCI